MSIRSGRVATRIALIGCGALALVALTAVDATEEDFDCEQAVSHLQGCCPNFDPHRVNCTSSGCGTHPVLTPTESKCIIALSCTDVGAQGLCPAVENLATPHPDAGSSCLK